MGSCLLSPTGLFRHQPRGLIAHSLNVTRTLLRLRGLLAPWLSEESCVIVGLYHDVGKVGEEGKPYYIRTVGADGRRTGRWDYRVNRQVTHLDLATRSLVLVSRFVPLQLEEAQAIRFHDGQYIRENRCVAHRETPLTLLLHYVRLSSILHEKTTGHVQRRCST